MAGQRRSKAGTKRPARPIAERVLGSLAELPLAPDVADEIEMLWTVIGPVGHRRFVAGVLADDADEHDDNPDEHDDDEEEDVRATLQAGTRAIAERVRKRAARADFRARLIDITDDTADQHAVDLAALVRRDPRYLGSDLVVGTVLLWKLHVVRGTQHHRRGAKRDLLAERARKCLDEIADAARAVIATVTGRGRQEYIDPAALLADHERHVGLIRGVVGAFKTDKSNDEIADETGLPASTIADIRAQPNALNKHATNLTIELYQRRFGERQLGRYLQAAGDAVTKMREPDDREVDALAREHRTLKRRTRRQ